MLGEDLRRPSCSPLAGLRAQSEQEVKVKEQLETAWLRGEGAPQHAERAAKSGGDKEHSRYKNSLEELLNTRKTSYNNKQQETIGREENLITRIITL